MRNMEAVELAKATTNLMSLPSDAFYNIQKNSEDWRIPLMTYLQNQYKDPDGKNQEKASSEGTQL